MMDTDKKKRFKQRKGTRQHDGFEADTLHGWMWAIRRLPQDGGLESKKPTLGIVSSTQGKETSF